MDLSYKKTTSRHPSQPRSRPGFTIYEVFIVLVVIIILMAILLPTICGNGNRRYPRSLKCGTQVRGVVQSMVIWAQNNQGNYPLPSMLDKDDATLKIPAASKDTTGNMMSLLIYTGGISPELLVSPAEQSGVIVRQPSYQYSKPELAANPEKALWDPAFRGTPADVIRTTGGGASPATPGSVGHNSYAPVVAVGARKAMWTDSYSATEAVFGNRGPTFVQSDFAPGQANWKLLDGPLGTGSITLLIHGGRTTWEGNIGYNDGHVNFETQANPDTLTYWLDDKKPHTNQSDNLFVSETDEFNGDTKPGEFAKSKNMYLRPISQMSAEGVPTVWRD